MLQKAMVGVFIGIISVLLIILISLGTNGEKLEYELIEMRDNSGLEELSATCGEYYGEVISTVALYDEFVETCDLTEDYDYDTAYFEDNVFVVYFYTGTSSRVPKGFNDYLFTISGKQVVVVRNRFALFAVKQDVWNLYLIEINKDKIASSEILFD